MTAEPEELDDDYLETPKEEPAPPQSKLKFGWCLTNHHEKCLVTVQKLTCTCPCPNHGTQRESLPGVSESFQQIVDKYYPNR